jgi:hypothetical protein
MMRFHLPFAAVLLLSACAAPQPQSAAPPAQAAAAQPAPAAALPPNCSEFLEMVTVEGKPVQATVRACLQPDDSWQITQTTPGLPVQVYDVAPPAYPWEYYDYVLAGPWYFDPFFGFGFGFLPEFIFVEHFHHHHHWGRPAMARGHGGIHGGGFHGGGHH